MIKRYYEEFKKKYIWPFRLIRVKNYLRVYKAREYSLVRVGDGGRSNDGAYVMLDDFGVGGTAYSCGLGTEIWWDECMIEKGYRVHGFDHTIDSLPEMHSGLDWHRIGISDKDDEANSLLSLKSITERWGNDSGEDNCDRRRILKMDIEGCEWDAFYSAPSEVLKKFDQITLELHALSDPYRKNLRVLKKLKKTHNPVWIHANNVGRLKKGLVDIPSELEVTYASKDRYKFDKTTYNSPIDIDKKNSEARDEIYLRDWGTKRRYSFLRELLNDRKEKRQ